MHPTTSEIIYNREEVEFLKAIQNWKEIKHRQFPTWSEILSILKKLGYEKTGKPASTLVEYLVVCHNESPLYICLTENAAKEELRKRKASYYTAKGWKLKDHRKHELKCKWRIKNIMGEHYA